MTDLLVGRALDQLPPLGMGTHVEGTGACVMEAVSWVAGEPWSARPHCASVAVSAVLRSWNDGLPTDEDRDRLLRPLVPEIIGSAGDQETEERRSMLALDWMVRVYTPAWLSLAGLGTHAAALRGLDELVDTDDTRTVCEWFDASSVVAAQPLIRAAKAAAWAHRIAVGMRCEDAVWTDARNSAGDAASDTASTAAGDAVLAGALAAADGSVVSLTNSAGNDALSAATNAAWAVAWDATDRDDDDAIQVAAGGPVRRQVRRPVKEVVGDALAGTVAELQRSAVDLVRRMLAAAHQGGRS